MNRKQTEITTTVVRCDVILLVLWYQPTRIQGKPHEFLFYFQRARTKERLKQRSALVSDSEMFDTI